MLANIDIGVNGMNHSKTNARHTQIPHAPRKLTRNSHEQDRALFLKSLYKQRYQLLGHFLGMGRTRSPRSSWEACFALTTSGPSCFQGPQEGRRALWAVSGSVERTQEIRRPEIKVEFPFAVRSSDLANRSVLGNGLGLKRRDEVVVAFGIELGVVGHDLESTRQPQFTPWSCGWSS